MQAHSALKASIQWPTMGATNVSVRIKSGTARKTIAKLNALRARQHMMNASPVDVKTDAGTA